MPITSPTVDYKGKEFAWDDIEILMLGRTMYDVTSISYTPSREVEAVYGKSTKANRMSTGRITLPRRL